MMEESLVVIVRSLIAFFTLLIYTRLLGKQQMGNLSYFDYINGITIGSIGGTLATDLTAKAWAHWIGLTTFILLTVIFQFVSLKSRYFSKIVDGEPTVVIQDGKILEHNLSRMRVKMDELMMLLRQKNTFDLTTVEFAVLEPDGNLSVLSKAQHQPITPNDLQMSVSPAGMVTEVIIDGVILEQNLKQKKKDRSWLELQLKAEGIQGIEQVAFAAILPNGQLYIDKFSDQVNEENDISDYKGPY